MPFMKVNVNGRKYVISGLTDDTSSQHILCSLARADSSFHLETTEFSDSSMEMVERTKGTRVRKTRRTRVRQSSISSLEIVDFDKKRLRGRLTQNKLIDLESSEWSDGHGIANLHNRSKKITANANKAESKLVDFENLEWSEEHRNDKIDKCSETLEITGNKNGSKMADSETSECSEGDGTKKETKKLTRKFSFKDILKSVKFGHVKSEECHTKSQDYHANNEECHAKCKECQAKTKESDTTCKECQTKYQDCHTKHEDCTEKCKDCHANTKESDKKIKECHKRHSHAHAKCKAKECYGQSSEESVTGSNATSNSSSKYECHKISSHATKRAEKRRKRRTKKRPVSQDVTEWKGKTEETNGKLNDLVKKRWKSADDIRESSQVAPSQDKKTSKELRKHKTKRKSKHSHSKIDKKSFNDETISISSIDASSQFVRVRRRVRKDLGDLRIQSMISRTIDQRVVDLHLACMKSYACPPPLNHPANEQEIRAKLLQLIESQQKCLTALKKSEKQNKKAISRYNKYLNLDKDEIQFYGIDDTKKLNAQRTRKLSDTDTGISEMHSDSSTETTQVHQGYQDDLSDNFSQDDVTQNRNDVMLKNADVTQCRCDSGLSQIDDMDLQDDITPGDDVLFQNNDDDLSFPFVDDDIISPPEDFINPVDDEIQNYASTSQNCVITVDAIAIDESTHDVKTYVYEKDDDTQSEIIVAQPTDVIGSATASSLVPYRSTESITMSTLSDISDSSFHGNGSDVEELTRVLSQEQQRERDLRRKLERQAEEIRLMDLRIKEHEKMTDILEKLKDLNQEVVEDKDIDNSEESNFLAEKENLEKSKKLSVNLYEYQKSEISKNSSVLELIESQIRRKRWHVDSAVRELERLVSSSSQSRLDRIRSFEHLPAGFAGLSIGSGVIDETLV